jgi:hypothetical protein
VAQLEVAVDDVRVVEIPGEALGVPEQDASLVAARRANSV